MVSLREIVERYAALAEHFGKPVALSAFGLSVQETENLFSGFDEDYQISRYLHFSHGEGEDFTINGEAVTHVAIESEVRTLL